MYDISLSCRSEQQRLQSSAWPFELKLSTEHVWDAFVNITLLEDYTRRDLCLQVPHIGDQKDRFHAAMHERNEHIIRFGQPELQHFCDRCMRVFEHPDGTKSKCQVVVTDGITLGHPCCGEFRCPEPLINNCARFCQTHAHLHNICAITGCNLPIIAGTKTCGTPEHCRMEKLNKDRGGASFALKERLIRHRVAHPNDSMGIDSPDAVVQLSLDENIEWFEIDPEKGVRVYAAANQGSVGLADTNDDTNSAEDLPWQETIPVTNDPRIPCPSKSAGGNKKFKAQFGRRRTHNEQILVRPCGVIVARATFFGAEAVSNVLVST